MKSYHFTHIIFAIFALFITTQARAEQWYQVELVVFEQLNAYTDEQWPFTSIAEAELSPTMANAYIQPAKTEKLTNIVGNLNRSAGYRVHYYQAWQQSMLTKGRSKTIAVNSSDGLISGSIQLYKATYLHAKLDLWMMENPTSVNSWSDVTPSGADINAPRNPHLDESRRIRSRKVYLFDHPKFGALLELTPIATPEAAQVGINKLESFSLPTEAAPTVSE